MKLKTCKVFSILLMFSCILFTTFDVHAELKLASVYPTLGVLGEDLDVILTGTGFDEYTRVSMYIDSGNKRNIVGSVDTPGAAVAITVVGNYAYVADRTSGLQVIDISNPSNPQIVASADTPGDAWGVTVSGRYAYVADEGSGLQVIDISNPSNPQIVGSVDTPGAAVAITVVANYAYVADGSGLQVIDISNPLNPQIIGSVDTPGFASDITVVGNYAYVADRTSGLQVIDISNPSNPQIVGSLDMPGWANGITVIGNYAYVANMTSGLQIIDISNPSNPQIVGSVDTPGDADDITVVANYAYVADFRSGVQVIDISNPSNPQVVGSMNTPGFAEGIAVAGNYAYVADWIGGLQVIDISISLNPQIIGSVDTPGVARGITVVGNYAYVADGLERLQVIDISNPSNPQIVGSVDTPGDANDITVSSNYAYVADGLEGLQVIDISNPSNPQIVGSVDTPGDAVGITVVGNNAYVADRTSGLQVIDISNLSNPQIVGSVETPGYASDITVVGNYAYVTVEFLGLQVIDISNPSNPQIIGSVDTPGAAVAITVVGNYAYVAAMNGLQMNSGLQVIHISNPSNPQIVGSVETQGYANDITVVGNYAYVVDMKSGLYVIDTSNPSNPQIVGSVDTPGDALGIIVVGNYAYVAAGANGLLIVSVPIEIESVTVNDDTRISLTLPSPVLAGHYTLRVFNETEYYELPGAVTFTEETVSKAIIVAGFGPPDLDNGIVNNIWEETQMLATWAYKALIYQGYTHEKHYYLSPVDFVPYYFGDQVINIRDGDATAGDLSYAINTWAGDPGNPAYNLLLYMVDHGGPEYYRIKYNEILYAQDLDTWLDDVQAAMSGKLMFIYEACQSGSFIPSIIPPDGNELDRIVMTSSAHDEPSVIDQSGMLTFSFQFWASVLNGDYVVNAFNFGRTMMKSFQDAKLDANGDGVANTKEDNIAGLVIGRGYRPASDIPYISTVSASQTLHGESTAVLSASGIVDANGIDEVWAVIIGPDYNFGAPDIPIKDLPKVALLDPDEDGTYEGTYPDFTMSGTYQVSIYAMDQEGTTSLPRNTTVTQMSGPDIYEEDDTYSQSNVIVLHDAVQEHNFHDTGDEDWIKFYGLFEENYTIKASNLGNSADVVIELYDSDGTTLLETQDTIGDPQSDEILEWTCPQDGIYYVKVKQYNPNVSGENTEYDLEVYRPIAPDLPAIVTGTVADSSSRGSLGNVQIKTSFGASAISLPNGTYIMFHPSGTYTLTAKATGYENYVDTITPTSGQTTTEDINMDSICSDSDLDGVCDVIDNCSETGNAGQEDTDGDGYGNMCDADLDNDGFVGPIDYDIFGQAWWTNPSSPNWNSHCDLDSDGLVGPIDYDLFGQRWWKSEPWR